MTDLLMAEPLRVANVITRMAGGAGAVVLRGALALDPDRFQVTIITGETAPGEEDLASRAEACGLTVVRLPTLVRPIDPRRDIAALRTLTATFATGGFEVAHTHTAKAGAVGRLAARRAGVPLVVHTLHGLPFHDFQPAWRRSLYITAERTIGRHTDVFLAVGDAVAAEATRRRIGPVTRVRTVLPAVDRPVAPPNAAARRRARQLLGVPDTARVVGTVARIDYQKAPEHWVDAVAEVDRADLWGVWIGDGPLRTQMLERVRRHGMTDRFRHLGHREDVLELLPGLDVFALASRYEGLPCALIEAMSAELPVVATAVNAVPDVVVPGVTGELVPPAEPRLLARAIQNILRQPERSHRMAVAGRMSVEDRFTAAALGGVLSDAYRLARRPPQTPDRRDDRS